MSSNPFDAFDQAQAMTRMWTDMAGKMWSAALGWQPASPPPEAARQVRSDMFRAMSQFFDQFMRSPQMLECMKQSMDVTTNFRQQFDEFLTRLRHQSQATTSQDIDSLMLSIRHMETRVLDRLDEMGVQMRRLQRRLDELEGGKEENGEENSRAERLGRSARKGSQREEFEE